MQPGVLCVRPPSRAALSALCPFRPSMLIYYLQSIARSLKLSNHQLKMQIQNASIASLL